MKTSSGKDHLTNKIQSIKISSMAMPFSVDSDNVSVNQIVQPPSVDSNLVIQDIDPIISNFAPIQNYSFNGEAFSI